jgi:DNA-binding protein HU-beta
MKKSDLITALASNAGLPKRDAERALNGILAAITDALKQGDDVRLTGFGTFSVAHRAATQGRNPRTGAAIEVAGSRQPKFRAGKSLKEAVN